MKPLRSTKNILQVYAAMLQDPGGQHYALELSRDSRVNIGTIYAVLARLEQHGIVTSAVEDVDPSAAGRPVRRYYRFTGDGLKAARQDLADAQRAFTIGGFANA
ncbi:PadR family transcriptional regulator [Deinococcus enclensis]|uniref:DNA-binding transcriptional ArsR family regulator n=1 Tax=Deinococcus enclensis TaxID=1049582 RepID=A0ABT9MIP7_9DEIO|nr:PadR family transcriptional regulator [Deinococcus enclensis]MDP9766477.1 DNA-binding transcriptional ArsR family regulator [Deinococcus enclensis]